MPAALRKRTGGRRRVRNKVGGESETLRTRSYRLDAPRCLKRARPQIQRERDATVGVLTLKDAASLRDEAETHAEKAGFGFQLSASKTLSSGEDEHRYLRVNSDPQRDGHDDQSDRDDCDPYDEGVGRFG
jgi:hypothetical protein